jgi:hypothetical protein
MDVTGEIRDCHDAGLLPIRHDHGGQAMMPGQTGGTSMQVDTEICIAMNRRPLVNMLTQSTTFRLLHTFPSIEPEAPFYPRPVRATSQANDVLTGRAGKPDTAIGTTRPRR